MSPIGDVILLWKKRKSEAAVTITLKVSTLYVSSISHSRTFSLHQNNS